MAKERNTYIFDDKEFHSIKELSQYTGINEKTITARLRRGMTTDQACSLKDLRCTYYEDGNDCKSIAQICEEYSKDVGLVRNRLKYGYTIHNALNTPKKISKQGKPIVVNGILYNSIAEAIRKLGLTDKENIIRGRLSRGQKPNEAFSFLSETPINRTIF